LTKEGARIVVNNHNNETNAQNILNEIKKAGSEAILVKADVTKKADVEAMITASVKAYGSSIVNLGQ
jgi:NAD(P)-dependent dehydrogenase (short-subunit alcohol dehydrogenase family)